MNVFEKVQHEKKKNISVRLFEELMKKKTRTRYGSIFEYAPKKK